jgi:hypothetical protein
MLGGVVVYVVLSSNPQSIEAQNSIECDFNTERMTLKYGFNGDNPEWVCAPISYDQFLLDKIESLENRVSDLEGSQSYPSVEDEKK